MSMRRNRFGGGEYLVPAKFSYVNAAGADVRSGANEDEKFVFKDASDLWFYQAKLLSGHNTSIFKSFDGNVNYTVIYNDWLMASHYDMYAQTVRCYANRTCREPLTEIRNYVQWETRKGLIKCEVREKSHVKKEAVNRAAYSLLREVLKHDLLQSIQSRVVRFQSDEQPQKLTEQGDISQSSDKHSNTIITTDQTETVVEPTKALDYVSTLVTTEPTHRFPTITDRWMPLDPFEVNINQKFNDIVKTYYLPEGVYTTTCAPNLMPFETFIYGRMDIELKIVSNANKFHVGKVVVSSKYDSYQVDLLQSGVQSALNRNHIILDLTANNEARLSIPFRYHRPYIRLVNKESSRGVRTGKFCSVYVHILSPLQTGPDGASSIGLRTYYRLKNCEFAGMSYRVQVQMLGVEQFITNKTSKALKELLSGAERAFDQLGSTVNQDKPGVSRGDIIVPRPRMNFCTGKGSIDVTPLRINPYTLTNADKIHIPTDEPKDFYELSRIWGIYKSFKWSATRKENDELVSFIMDPSLRNYDKDYNGEITPLEYAVSNFMFWSGTIELRFDFVSNSFHTGMVQISAEFGRRTSSNDVCQSSSTYVKNFHLGEQKTVSFRIPYIYDTVMRRSTSTVMNLNGSATTSNVIKSKAITVAPLSNTYVKVKVINPLRPVASAPQEIEILVFCRAGRNFSMHGLKTPTLRAFCTIAMDSFPVDYDPDKLVNNNDVNKWNERLTRAVKFQMDTGSKEDQDETENFKEGQCLITIQTLDCHMSFKDLIRRPCNIIHRINMSPSKAGEGVRAFYIPLMPPQRSMSLLSGSDGYTANNIWSPAIVNHTTTSIMNMFRCWRGGMRYTIIIEETSNDKTPIYVTLIPHTGIRKVGQHDVYSSLPGQELHLQGFITEFIMPNINNTITIEAPYDTENTWTLMHEENSQLNYTWRDKGDHNSGHLCISSAATIRFSVWWSAADDFALANFYGVPQTFTNDWAYRYGDNRGPIVKNRQRKDAPTQGFSCDDVVTKVTDVIIPECQMDRIAAPLNEVGNVIKEVAKVGVGMVTNPKSAVRLGISCVPVVGPGLVTTSVINDIMEKVDNSMGDINKMRDLAQSRITGVSDRINSAITEFRETNTVAREGLQSVVNQAHNTIVDVRGQIDSTMESFKYIITRSMDSIASQFGTVFSSVQMVYDFLLDLFTAWGTKSWLPIGVGIVRLLTKTAFVSFATALDLHGFGVQLSDWLAYYFSSPIPQVQIDIQMGGTPITIISILLGLIGTIMGVHLDSRRNRPFLTALLERMTTTTGVSYFVQVLRYVESIFVAVKNLIMEALGYVSTEANALRMLSEKNNIIAGFMREAQIITSEVNTSVINIPQFRIRFWKTVLQAQQLQRLILQVPNNVVSPHLAKLCSDVIRIGNEKFLDAAASPVRYEPMVIFVEGTPGVGKSFVSEYLASALLAAIGFEAPASGKVFQRTAGERFWSGYRDQPIVVYDEFLNSMDPQRCMDMIVEFQKIKSTATFIPEMAHLEEKKIRANPLLVICLCNGAFPNISSYSRYPTAIWRRRDVVLRVERTDRYRNVNLRELDDEAMIPVKRGEHLQYQMYGNVMNERSLIPDRVSHRDTVSYLCEKFKYWHARELRNVQQRMEMLPTIVGGEEMMRIEDPFALFYSTNHRLQIEAPSQNAWTPYEQLEAAVTMVGNAVYEHQNQVAELIPLPNLPVWGQPAVQGIGGAILGFMTACPFVGEIAKYSRDMLEDRLMGMSEVITEFKQCCICLEDVECTYCCETTYNTDTKHLICMSCRESAIAHGATSCPMCRCTYVVPLLSVDFMEHLTVWQALVVRGARSIQWLTDCLIGYFEIREGDFRNGLIIDYCLHIAYALANGPDFSFSIGNALGRWCGIITDFVSVVSPMFQMDSGEGNLVEPSVSQIVPVWALNTAPPREETYTSIVDKLEPVVNEEQNNLLDDVMGDNPVCLHGDIDVVTLRCELDSMKVVDRVTRTYVNLSYGHCGTQECPFIDRNYRLDIFKRYVRAHKQELRHQYIQFINSKNRRILLPSVLRPVWMQPIVLNESTSWWESLTGVWEKYGTYIKYALGITAVISSVVTMYSMVLNTAPAPMEQVAGGTVGSSTYASPRHRKIEVRRGLQTHYFEGVSETPSVLEVVRKYIIRNTVKFILGEADKCIVMYGIGLFNHYLILPRHYVYAIMRKITEEQCSLYIEPEGKPQLRQKINVKMEDFIVSKTSDIAYFHAPRSFPLFKDLSKFIAKETDFDEPLSPYAEILVVPCRNVKHFMIVPVELNGVEAKRVITDAERNQFEVENVLTYNYSQPGACGSLVMRADHTRPILSMHFAGAGVGLEGSGFGVLLTQESLSPLCQMNDVVRQTQDIKYETIENAQFIYDDNITLDYLGSVNKEETPFIPNKSRLVKSLLYGVNDLAVEIEPAILDKKDERYIHQETPLYAGVKKHGMITKLLPQKDILWAKELLWTNFYLPLKPIVVKPHVLSIKEAIMGYPNINHYKPLDLSTSVGYPYILGTKKKKRDFIEVARNDQDQIVDIVSIDESILENINMKAELRKKGIVPQSLFIDTLKDEKRPTEKVRKLGGTRVFCNGPIDKVIEDRRYFMHFVAAFMEKRFDLMHAVGINPMGSEWTRLTNSLLLKNSKFMSIDYANFGAGYNAEVAYAAYQLMIDWVLLNVPCPEGYTHEEYKLTLESLVYECLQSHHICSNTVYQQVSGSPSGAFFTTIINTLVNQFYILIAWKNLCGDEILKRGLSPSREFVRSVQLYTYGDDGIFSVMDEYIPLFNMRTITNFFLQYDISATNASKSKEIVEYEKLTEAMFLKRGFRHHETRKEWQAPLKWDSVLSATQWVWKSANLKESTLVNVSAALLQAHGHGREVFCKFKEKCNKALIARRMPPLLETFDELDVLFYETDSFDYEKYINLF